MGGLVLGVENELNSATTVVNVPPKGSEKFHSVEFHAEMWIPVGSHSGNIFNDLDNTTYCT